MSLHFCNAQAHEQRQAIIQCVWVQQAEGQAAINDQFFQTVTSNAASACQKALTYWQ